VKISITYYFFSKLAHHPTKRGCLVNVHLIYIYIYIYIYISSYAHSEVGSRIKFTKYNTRSLADLERVTLHRVVRLQLLSRSRIYGSIITLGTSSIFV